MLWVLFTFPSRYWYTIGLWRVFSLGGWSRRIHTGFHVPRATQDPAGLHDASCKGLSPAPVELSRTFHSRQSCRIAVLQPPRSRNSAGLGSTPFARHYLGHHILFSLPPGTKMFQFPGFAPIPGMGDGPSARRVAPFGNPWVTGRLHLTTAYRSLPRPSSPSRAKASAVRPFLLSPRPCRHFHPEGGTALAFGPPNTIVRMGRAFLVKSTFSIDSLAFLRPTCITDPQASCRLVTHISGETFLFCSSMSKTEARKHAHIVENNGFEPLTPCVQSRCSSQLS